MRTVLRWFVRAAAATAVLLAACTGGGTGEPSARSPSPEDLDTDQATVIEPPTGQQGARRVWSDSAGRLWVSEWNTGQVSRYDPATGSWREWPLPGAAPQAYAVYVDERDAVWLTDFGGNAIWRFDPQTERFREFRRGCEPDRTRCPEPDEPGEIRQLLGRAGEVWAPESATDRLVVIRY